MPRKKKESKKIFENMPVEPDEVHHENANAEIPAETNAGLTESTEEKDNASALDPNQSEGKETPVDVNTSAAEPSRQESEESLDDLLEDVRHSLIEEEEAHEKEEQPKWWKRIRKGSRKNVAEPEKPKVVEEINLPNLDAMVSEETEQEVEPEEELDPIDELIDLLDTEEVTDNKPVVEKAPPEPEKVVDIEELKKQAFQPRPSAGDEQNLSEVRAIALAGDEEVFVEVQSTPQDPLEERLSAVENALKPYRRYIYFGLAMLGLVMAGIAAVVVFNIYTRSTSAAVAEAPVSNLPFPTSVSLPGGWQFQLGKGTLVDGNWNPQGAEWLQGTEVCRWVALPWSRQVEAVIRTLNPDDPIELGMSNNDKLTYKVYSVQQMSPEEMQELDSNSPCLLIVLAEPEAELRWVLTALP